MIESVWLLSHEPILQFIPHLKSCLALCANNMYIFALLFLSQGSDFNNDNSLCPFLFLLLHFLYFLLHLWNVHLFLLSLKLVLTQLLYRVWECAAGNENVLRVIPYIFLKLSDECIIVSFGLLFPCPIENLIDSFLPFDHDDSHKNSDVTFHGVSIHIQILVVLKSAVHGDRVLGHNVIGGELPENNLIRLLLLEVHQIQETCLFAFVLHHNLNCPHIPSICWVVFGRVLNQGCQVVNLLWVYLPLQVEGIIHINADRQRRNVLSTWQSPIVADIYPEVQLLVRKRRRIKHILLRRVFAHQVRKWLSLLKLYWTALLKGHQIVRNLRRLWRRVW